ncbi:unnamed protein product [Brassicogethes aeneus]|uniref:Uncharacterized protein n=1 Tax=Brassicogethes aeneus TaxID=1431903 RepID=A0A9P0ASV8_BRAAE|nr:unnamed protein product [Brassicogethes aeneus]
MSAIEGIKYHEYIIAVGALVSPRNITYASRIANNRICLYLSNTKIVDTLVNIHKFIKINDNKIEIRRLISPALRLIISNICPVIPHSIIENELLKLGLKAVSKITPLRVGMSEEYSHILSFRRQVYIEPSKNMSISDSILVTYDNTSYRIFLSIENLHCAKCSKIGHNENSCLTTNTESSTKNDNTPFENTHIENSLSTENNPESNESFNNEQPTLSKNQLKVSSNPTVNNEDQAQPTAKRQISLSPDIIASQNQETIFSIPTGSLTKKRKTKSTPLDIPTILLPIKDQIESHTPPFTLNYTSICDFLENSFSSQFPLKTANEYVEDIRSLEHILNFIYNKINNKTAKNRITRLKKKLSIGELSITEDESDNLELSDEETNAEDEKLRQLLAENDLPSDLLARIDNLEENAGLEIEDTGTFLKGNVEEEEEEEEREQTPEIQVGGLENEHILEYQTAYLELSDKETNAEDEKLRQLLEENDLPSDLLARIDNSMVYELRP